MAVLHIQDLQKSFGERLLFKGLNMQLEVGEKAALVGANGTGKTTLLRCIAGLEENDGGVISIAKGARIGYLAQTIEINNLKQLLWDFMLAEYQDLLEIRRALKRLELQMASPEYYGEAGRLQEIMKQYSIYTEKYECENGYSCESKIKEVLFGLRFSANDLERSLHTFSGGQKTRLYLARILLREPELLLLDEPNNYLDLKAVEWLEAFLQKYNGTVLVVSHDRYFLDVVASKIFELENCTITHYPGNYSNFVLQKALKSATQSKEYAKEQEKIKRLQEYIRKNKAGVNARQAKGREKQLARLGSANRPGQYRSLSFAFQQAHASGAEVLTIKDLNLSYPGLDLLEGFNYKLRRGERVALLGPNGCGKTTLLKAVLGQGPYQGTIRLGSGVKTGYFAQEHQHQEQAATILEATLHDSNLTVQAARDLLARFDFKGEEVYKPIEALSGGEKSRLVLAKLLLAKANFLVLDEPTNHLDVYARQGLEEALAEYDGTLLFVSHDRYFINRLADKILEFEQGKVTEYPGDYDYYRAKKALENTQVQLEKSPGKERVKPKPVPKPELLLKKLEQEIFSAEEELEELAQSLGDTALYSNPEQAVALQQAYQELERKLQGMYRDWENAVESMQER